MKLIFEFQFNDKIIEFDLGGTEVMVNATEMAGIYKKRPIEYLKQKETKRYLEVLQKSEFGQFRSDSESLLNLVNADLKYENDLRSKDGVLILRTAKGKGVDGGATWMHRYLALDFAGWLDPEFKLWMVVTIDKLIHEYGQQTKDTIVKKAKLHDKKEVLIRKLQTVREYQELVLVDQNIRRLTTAFAKFQKQKDNELRSKWN